MKASSVAVLLIGLVAGIALTWYIGQQRGGVAVPAKQVAVEAAAPQSAATDAAAAPAMPAGLSRVREISAEQRAAMIEALSGDFRYAGSPVWFSTTPNNAEATGFQKLLQSVFEGAGWEVKGNRTTGFSMKPGIYVFAADMEPPEYVNAISAAFEAAGIELASNGRGYRDYYRERKAENPNFTGFEMDEDQSFVIAIGRMPEAPTPAP